MFDRYQSETIVLALSSIAEEMARLRHELVVLQEKLPDYDSYTLKDVVEALQEIDKTIMRKGD